MDAGQLQHIAVIGAGTMGSGIAQVAAQAGYQVALYDSVDGAAARALGQISEKLAIGVARGKVSDEEREAALGRLRVAGSLVDASSNAGLVVEAVIESLEVKKDLFAQLDRIAPADAILATNTSSLSVTAIAGATTRPGQVLGMHFFNPVHLMKLL
jgi:3-hydroxybutyryl-CoA dehydrogenase